MQKLFHSVTVLDTSNMSGTTRNPLIDHANVLRHTILFASNSGYLFVAGVSKPWKKAWRETPRREPVTHVDLALQSPACMLWANDCDMPTARLWLNPDACLRAARGGYLDTLVYADAQGLITMDPQDFYACAAAAEAGHLDVVKWCFQRDRSWDILACWDSILCSGAAAGGHLEVR